MSGEVAVCTVDGAIYYGNEYEHKAVLLKPGDRVHFKGHDETVRMVWFYDGPTVDLESGVSIHPDLGDTFETLEPAS